MPDISFESFNLLINNAFSTHPEVIPPDDVQKNKLFRLAELLLSENEKYNLTAIRTLEGVMSKHIFDSICVESYIPRNATVIDVGAGAGFPTLPLAIMRPDISITPLDSTDKKIEFIKKAAEALELQNVHPVSARAEELANDPAYREGFDIVIARSVAALPILSELCLPFVKLGGRFLSMKSASAAEEIPDSLRGVGKLGGGEIEVKNLYIDDSENQRCLFIVDKIAKTPKELPRRYAQIKKKPL